MLAEIMNSAGLWGFLGSLIYAGPRLTACLFTAKDAHPHLITNCVMDFVIALFIGGIAAAAFGPWMQSFLHRTGDHELRAISAMIGLLANQPRVIDALSGRFVRLLSNTKGE